jgi:hypothetical protein
MIFIHTNIPFRNIADNVLPIVTSELELDSISESSPSVSKNEYCPSAISNPVVYILSNTPPTSDEEANSQHYIGRFLVLSLLGLLALRIL